MKKIYFLVLVFSFSYFYAQLNSLTLNEIKNLEYIELVENQPNKKPKISHTESLCIDLIRDLFYKTDELKFATQYNFPINKQISTSLVVSYTYEFETIFYNALAKARIFTDYYIQNQ